MSSQHCSRAIGGWLAGCGAATAVLGAFTFVTMATASGGNVAGLVGALVFATFPLWLIFLVMCVLTAVPAAIVIMASEKYRIRAVAFFGCAGAGIGAVTVELLSHGSGPRAWIGAHLLFAIAGLAAGVAYWRVAGRHAGQDQSCAT